MPRSHFSRVFLGSAVVALALPLAAQAQMGGFAVQLGMSRDFYELPRVSVSLFGTTSELASSYVRGCAGFVTSEAQGAAFEVTERLDQLAFTVEGDGVKAMVLGTPDGLFRCVLADERGYVADTLMNVAPGLYRVWAAASDGVPLRARVFAGPRPVSAVELFGLDLDSLGAPRQGRAVLSPPVDGGSQVLASGAPLVARDEMLPLSADYCAGYGGLDAPDMILDVEAVTGPFSIFATSRRDLTLAVATPSGEVLCNDDSYQLNPAITIENGASGAYAIFVGGFSPGDGDVYTLMASAGGPNFASASAPVNLDAEPRHGRVALDLDAALIGQVIGTNRVSAVDSFESLPTGGFCPGYGDFSAPDYMVSVNDADVMFSLYAHSTDDLVMAVRDPNGAWYCSDDSNGLNPAVVIGASDFGDYAVYVGTYSELGSGANYELLAALGQPNWAGITTAPQGAGGGGNAPAINGDAAPLLGSIGFDAATVLDPRVILDVRSSVTDAFALGGACAGFIDLSAPDIAITAGEGLTQMMIYMVSDADGTLAVVGPDGTLYCNDDFEALNPGIVIPSPQPGDYRVYAGTYGGDGGVATLGVTRSTPLWSMDSVQ